MFDWIKERLGIGKGQKAPDAQPELPDEEEETPEPDRDIEPVSTEIGHAWQIGRTHDNGTPKEYYCANRGCGNRVSQSYAPEPGICPGGETIEGMISPRA